MARQPSHTRSPVSCNSHRSVIYVCGDANLNRSDFIHNSCETMLRKYANRHLGRTLAVPDRICVDCLVRYRQWTPIDGCYRLSNKIVADVKNSQCWFMFDAHTQQCRVAACVDGMFRQATSVRPFNANSLVYPMMEHDSERRLCKLVDDETHWTEIDGTVI